MQNSLVFRDGCLEVVWNVRFVCIESIGIVNLLIVNVHFNTWKNWMHYVVYIGNSSYFFLFFFVICSCFSENNRLIFVLLFLFLTVVCIVTTTLDKFELQCQKRLSQINVIVPIRLKFKLYAVFIKWGSWINFLFMRRQDIVNQWDFLSKISRHCHKRLVRKIVVWHDQREMFVKMSLCDRLDCLLDFVGMILLPVLFLLPPCLPYVCDSLPPTASFRLLPCRTLALPTALRLPSPSPNCFFRLCFPTLFAAALKFFLPLTTSALSGTANSNKSAPTRFAAGTIYLRKKRIAVLSIICARAPNPLLLCLPTAL